MVGMLEGCFYERFQSAKIDKKGIIEGILPFVASLTLLYLETRKTAGNIISKHTEFYEVIHEMFHILNCGFEIK